MALHRSIYLPEEEQAFWDRCRRQAHAEGLSMSELVRFLLHEWASRWGIPFDEEETEHDSTSDGNAVDLDDSVVRVPGRSATEVTIVSEEPFRRYTG